MDTMFNQYSLEALAASPGAFVYITTMAIGLQVVMALIIYAIIRSMR